MTGIERLRELVDDTKGYTATEFIVKPYRRDKYAGANDTLWKLFADIVDQIEREQDAMVADSPYDALPPDERDAIAWVREHGGLSHVKDICHDFRAVVERLGIEWSESELHGLMDAIDRRLMPDGMEWLVEAWPRFEGGEPVRLGEEAIGFSRKPPFVVDHVVLFDGGEATVCAEADHGSGKAENFIRVFPGERVKRPAPRALDADGVDVELGDDLYSVEGGLKFHVSYINRVSNKIATDAMFALDKWADPAMYTHRAPVLAADGRPLREGETVWSVDSGTRYTVEKITDELIPIKCRSDMGSTVSLHQSQLTHERPESWERIEEDAKSLCHDIAMYLGDYSPSDFKKSGDSVQDRVIETVRRCRALAERGE